MNKEIESIKLQVANELAFAIAKVFKKSISIEQVVTTLERPKDSNNGDYAFPCFRFGKPIGEKPQDIAARIAEELNQSAYDLIENADAIGPFLNLRLDVAGQAEPLFKEILNSRYFSRAKSVAGAKPEKVMIEYSQPNTHKSFHVGHMRNVALGDSLGRLYDYCGFDVTMVNYIGDEGAHIAKCLWYIEKTGAKPPADNKGDWLGEMYVKACELLHHADGDEKKLFDQQVSDVLAAIESKSGPRYEFWLESKEWSIDDFKDVYEWTDAKFDHWFAESDVSEESQKIVDEYLAKGLFKQDDGAIGLDLSDDKLGFVLLRKRDGNTLYATKDLALARRKFHEFQIDRSIYVVAAEQNLHFKQVFKTLEKMGFPQAKNCYHLSYGMVVLPTGKMSSRKGNQIYFKTLKSELAQQMSEKLAKYKDEWSREQYEETLRRLSVGAIRYGMINSDPVKDIVFNMDEWLSFEGNTGPYLMYAYARTQSILRKAKERDLQPSQENLGLLSHPDEVELIRFLVDFNSIAAKGCEQNRLSGIAHHLFDMCKVYSRMLANVSILKADTDKLAASRLTLLNCFAKVLKQGLTILGIEPPERM